MKKEMSMVFCALALTGVMIFSGCNRISSSIPKNVTIQLPDGIPQNTGSSDWLAVRKIALGVNTITIFIEAVIKISELSDVISRFIGSFEVTLNYGGPLGNYDNIKISFESGITGRGDGYTKCFELWTKKGTNDWQKGLEYFYNVGSDTRGQIVFKPKPFDSDTSPLYPNSSYKLVFVKTSAAKSVTFYADNTTNTDGHFDNVKRNCAFLDSTGTGMSVYISAYLKGIDLNTNGTDDCYLFGAKIDTTKSNYPATAMEGICDQGGTHEFKRFGSDWSVNAGLFNKTAGLVVDGSNGGLYNGITYPLKSEIIESELPSAADIATAIAFERP
ncbi:MAG: hypothetical protein MUD12_07340 [Spirochaetes bacterium]|jgi:hypothetical protein|nr:hypothetical protein [Spirochaetota bacterium]